MASKEGVDSSSHSGSRSNTVQQRKRKGNRLGPRGRYDTMARHKRPLRRFVVRHGLPTQQTACLVPVIARGTHERLLAGSPRGGDAENSQLHKLDLSV